MKQIRVELGANSYDIRIGQGIIAQLGAWIRESGLSGRVALITNPVVDGLHGAALVKNLTGEGLSVDTLLVPDGEEQKSLEAAGRLYKELSRVGADRSTLIIALGGGVIGDLAGFVAATYLRGLPLVQVPTTLLAQVDSSIGGKVAVNYGQLKNNIGAFYQPKLVISDILTLATLKPGTLSDGLAEVIKYAMIRDKDLFVYLEEHMESIKARGEATLETIVARSAEIKAEVVSQDEKDTGLRQVLNYGHTVGHAIESASDFKVCHGQAVALGMLAAARISRELGRLSGEEVTRLENVIGRAGLPTLMPRVNRTKLINAMRHDKKVKDGRLRFILSETIGKVFVSEDVSQTLVEKVIGF